MSILRKNHKFLTVAAHVQEICQPLRTLNSELFTYMKNFHDGTQINISSNAQWIEDYYALELYKSSCFESNPTQYEKGFKWWHESSDAAVIVHGRDNFNSYNGITFCNPVTDGVEFFFFSPTKFHKSTLDFYLNHLDLLEKFVLYFQQNTKHIIKDSYEHRIIRRQPDTSTPKINYSSSMFLNAIHFKSSVEKLRFARFLSHFEPLTSKELEYFHRMLNQSGCTKSIAKAMNRSPRTVEHHISKLLDKLQCRTKQELMIKLIDVLID